ncbi:LytTR family DNA-binding domain-containing protein [Chitinophaga horti]|uniref:LytTR family DNA-binding domain-containing protein n=1 Tax=Chitinophaga horti TaxID=2920382 RepID=A0ABY6J699_9BACT|nr:LytTR family DNA-binding domain-containing protein [Chitinophaga horti]UYQ95210.1 LytTR family DNA-binding domain-containing protein [Chitinophaga horti]
MNLRCMIIDDEPLARKGLREYLADTPGLELTGEYEHPAAALPALSADKPDLLFLDIRMPKINGVDFLRSLPHPPMVIFTTAHSEYALDAFELNVIDYLVKPFSFERYLKAVTKARDFAARHRPEQPAADHFFIKCDNKLEKVMYDDILFVEALQNYIAVHTKQRKFVTYLTFKAMEDYLPVSHFIKVHKSFIVSLNKIDSIDGQDVFVAGHQLPVSRSLKDEVMARVLQDRYLRR